MFHLLVFSDPSDSKSWNEQLETFTPSFEYIDNASSRQIHEQGLFHKSALVFVCSTNGDLLLQKRSDMKLIFPSTWEPVGEHVKVGENFEQSAKRGVKEELGISVEKLEHILGRHLQCNTVRDENGEILFRDYEFVETYKTVVEKDTFIKPETKEIGKSKWFLWNEVEEMLIQNPKKLVPWVQKVLKLIGQNPCELEYKNPSSFIDQDCRSNYLE